MAQEQSAVGAGSVIRATGIITSGEAIAALRAVNLWSPWMTPAYLLFVVVSYLAAAAVMLPSLIGILQAVASMLLLLLLAWSFLGRNHPYRAYMKKWNEQPELLHPFAWTFSDEGLQIESLHASSFYRWSAFDSQATTIGEIVLVDRGAVSVRFVPKRCFGNEAACGLVAANLRLRTSASGVVFRLAQATSGSSP